MMEEKALKSLRASYEMYEKTKRQTEKNMKAALNPDGTKKYDSKAIAEEVALIERAQNDIVSQYVMAGGKAEDITAKNTGRKKASLPKIDNIGEKAAEIARDIDMSRTKSLENAVSEASKKLDQEYIPSKGTYDPDAAFDVIPLPSKGEGYADKISKVSVAYLTAYDENMIVSPNLYKQNLILDYILDAKLLSKEIQPMDLLEGDRDAIILFLRASGYGNEYPISATDEKTGKEFDAVVDLSSLKYKEFNLKGDSNGWFPFTLPISKKEIKFRFPTHKDTMILEKMQTMESASAVKDTIERHVSDLDTFIEGDEKISGDDKVKVRQAIRTIEKWGDDMEDTDATYNHALTNRLNLLVMSVDGITDKKYISEFIKRMNVRDSLALRKYMTANEPGVDYTITVQRPESLGGGSFKTFLQLDQFLFLNIPE